jgi:hypothetical protein
MLGFKRFETAAVTIRGIELAEKHTSIGNLHQNRRILGIGSSERFTPTGNSGPSARVVIL